VQANVDPLRRELPRALCNKPGSGPLGKGLAAGQEAGPSEEMGLRRERE
jgi:hypothetical protein